MNIIIPIGGIGQRFKDEGYEMPKPLISVLGKPMLYRVIENLKLDNDDNIYIVYHNHLKEYNFETLIKFYFPKLNIYFVSLDYVTKGAAETVLRCIETWEDSEIDKPVLILDCDTFYNEDIITKYKNSLNKNAIFYFNSNEPEPIFSYILLDGDKVIDIKEKEKISDNANTGAYGFRSGYELEEHCDNIISFTDNESYISKVYNNMLSEIETIGIEVKDFTCVGTPLQLQTYCNENKHKVSELRVCFDLDNTLVTHPVTYGDYSTVLPIQRNIDYLKTLKKLGNTIIIYTARRMRTHQGNVEKVIADIGKITLETLDKFEIPYDEIHFGKPYANFYIDDLAINANASLDKALGIYNTDIEPRSFNKIEYTQKTVIKETNNIGEIYWYQNIPKDIKYLFPKLLKVENNKLTLERIDGVNLSYWYTSKYLRISDLGNILIGLHQIHDSVGNVENVNFPYIYSNYTYKLTKRYFGNKSLYNEYEDTFELYTKINNALLDYESKEMGERGVIHGDPVLTNIIKTKTGLKFIDMRGRQGDGCTIYGDIYYDYAKLFQSLLGYDFILNGIEIDATYTHKLIEEFEKCFTQEELYKIKLITASLFFSLLPLHKEDKDKFKKYLKIVKSLCTIL
jgi:capsule biosynthesis phosphatase